MFKSVPIGVSLKADRFQRLAFDTGVVILAVAVLHIPPFIAALSTQDRLAGDAFLASFMVAVLLGGAMALGFQGGRSKHRQDQLIILPFCLYLAASVFSSLPFFFLSPDITAFPALYEGVSLITTSGASVFYDTGIYGLSFEIWRSLIAWLGGGMALILIMGVMMPMNAGGYGLHISAMVTDHGKGLEDRLLSVTWLIMPVYALVTLLLIVVLMLQGIDLFLAFQVSCGVVSLTGYPINGLAEIETLPALTICLGLLLVVINWDSLAVSLKSRNLRALKDPETKGVFFNLIVAMLLLLMILPIPGFQSVFHSFTLAISAISTSGWRFGDSAGSISDSVVLVTLGFAIIGGSALSASGGIKQLRGIAIRQIIGSELERLAHPNGIHSVKLGKATVSDADRDSLWLFLTLLICVMVLSIIILSALGLDLMAAVVNTIGHITLAAPLVSSPDVKYEGVMGLYDFELLTLSIVMIIARVDACILLVLLGRKFWKI